MKKAVSFILAASMALSSAALVTSAETAEVTVSCASARAESGWVTKSGKKYYYESGKPVTGVKTIDGKTYWFSKKGVMKTGWRTLSSGKKMFFRSNGEMATGWQSIGKDKYYFSKKGIMQTGCIIIEKSVYRFNDDGTYETMPRNEVIVINGKTYGTDSSGKLASGFTCIDDDYYYFGKQGYAVSKEVEKDGYIYIVDENGLVSIEKKAVDYSKVNVKVPSFVNDKINVYDLKLKNDKDGGRVTITGWIKPLANANYYATIKIELYDQNNSYIKSVYIANRSKIVFGDPYKIDLEEFVTDAVYSIKFASVDVY